jgi:hypothetical protein
MAKIIRVYADQVEAGDYIIVDTDRGRRVYHVCEVGISDQKVTIIYNARHGFEREQFDASDRVRIREDS